MAINVNPGSLLRHVQTFTASGNFTAPAGCTVAFVSIHSSTGGGGGGGRGGPNGNGSGGGSSGIVAGSFIEVIPGATHAVVIGGGGAGGAGQVVVDIAPSQV